VYAAPSRLVCMYAAPDPFIASSPTGDGLEEGGLPRARRAQHQVALARLQHRRHLTTTTPGHSEILVCRAALSRWRCAAPPLGCKACVSPYNAAVHRIRTKYAAPKYLPLLVCRTSLSTVAVRGASFGWKAWTIGVVSTSPTVGNALEPDCSVTWRQVASVGC
jgi:hypothetical protein